MLNLDAHDSALMQEKMTNIKRDKEKSLRDKLKERIRKLSNENIRLEKNFLKS